jgi:REP-associated tyrosine transposase
VAGEACGLTEVVRIVARVTGQAQVSASGVYELGYHDVWCPKYRWPVLAGRVAARCKELIRAKASEHSWRMVALEIMPDHVRLFVKAHLSDSPSRIVNQFKGSTSRRLRAEFPHLPALWSRSSSAATVGAVSAETVRRHGGTQNEGPWQEERAR